MPRKGMSRKAIYTDVIAIIALAALTGISGTAIGQDGQRQSPAVQEAQQQQPEKATVESFAVALAEVQKIQVEYKDKIEVAKEPEVATLLQREAQAEMVKAVQDKGLTVNQYNSLAQKMTVDPEFRGEVEQVMKDM